MSKRRFDLGAGCLGGSGLSVWNRLREVHGDYEHVAYIDRDRVIHWTLKNPPPSVVEYVTQLATGPNMQASTTQPEMKVFNT